MIEHKNINKNEGGLSVRAKINNMFFSLIEGLEGINNLWKSLVFWVNSHKQLESKLDIAYNELKEQIFKGNDYTDAAVADLMVYINGISGGVSGFAIDNTYDPKFPNDKAVTILAAGSGEYSNFLDSKGRPIVIEGEGAITIFYRGAHSTYWEHKTIYASVNIENIDGGNAE